MQVTCGISDNPEIQCFTTNTTLVGIKLKLTIRWDGF